MRTSLGGVLVAALFMVLAGCNGAAPRAYEDAVQNVYIGMDKREFDVVMREVNEKTRRKHLRRTEAYRRNGMLYEIAYVRSSNVNDDANTDEVAQASLGRWHLDFDAKDRHYLERGRRN